MSPLVICMHGFGQGTDPDTSFGKTVQAIAMKSGFNVWVLSWNPNRRLLRSLASQAAQHDVISTVHYSYGAGNGLQKLAKALWKYEKRVINDAFTIDPVPHLGVLKFLSLLDFGKFNVPENVLRVHNFYQKVGSPYGRAVRTKGSTRVEFEMEIEDVAGHTAMDDLQMIRDYILESLVPLKETMT